VLRETREELGIDVEHHGSLVVNSLVRPGTTGYARPPCDSTNSLSAAPLHR
jgi:8-oxo-dGTP pyrophosphatase MutT (NUDIX family)